MRAIRSKQACARRRGAAQANGLLILGLIVVVGVLTGAGLYRWFRGASEASLQAGLAEVPTTPEERLDVWLHFNAPQLHHRLAVVGRFTRERPWLVTHTLGPGSPPELWGLECSEIPLDLARREGMTVVVELPAPHSLGRFSLEAEQRRRVPHLDGRTTPDAARRLERLAYHMLEGMPAALEKEIPGATLVLRAARPD